MPDWVLDASAVLALIHDEPGADAVQAVLADGASLPAVNLAEVVSQLRRRGAEPAAAIEMSELPTLTVVPLTGELAKAAGVRHGELRHRGFSLADVICLETARALGATAVTADRAWGDLPDQVRIIR